MGGEPQKKANLTLDRQTGEVVKWEPFTGFGPGRRFRTILRFTHTGEVLGPVGQTIAGIVTFGSIFLVWTGISLASVASSAGGPGALREWASGSSRGRTGQLAVVGLSR
jgi:uncharacterized iron-regulated membrane protein